MKQKPNGNHAEDHDELTLPAVADYVLQQSVDTPDLTRSIMGRLGYMRVSAAVARRAQRRMWLQRGCLCLAFFGLMLSTVWMFQQSDLTRRPHGLTLPDALEHEQQRFNQMIRTIGNISPVGDHSPRMKNQNPDPPAPSSIDDDIDHSAVAPVRWV